MFSAPTTGNLPLIPLLLVDDHQVVIEGIKMLLKAEPDLKVAAQANSGEEALRRLREHPEVQVAVVDLNMPRMSGAELTRRVRQAFAGVRVLALSMAHDHESIQEMLQAGGAGYLLKNTSRQELGTAIRQVACGRTYFSPEVGQTLLQNLELPAHRAHDAPRAPELTVREREVLQLIAQEKSNHDIAVALFISERTVETHRKNMLTKTNSKAIVGLIQYALKNKLIQG